MARVFVTTKGNTFSNIIFCGCSAVSLCYYLKHTLLLKNYTNNSVLQENDGPVNPSARLLSIVNEVKQDVKSFTSENTAITPFLIPGMRTLHAGTIGTHAGGVIGLPVYFEFNNIEDVDGKIKNSSSLIDDRPVEELYKFFLLSDEAKKYGIAREILSVNTYKMYIEIVIPVGISFLINLFCIQESYFKNLSLAHPIQRCLFYTCLLIMGLSAWRLGHTTTTNFFIDRVDEDLASISQEYVEGAIEFYSKALERRSNKLELEYQNCRLLNTISDKIHSITSRNERSMSYKLEFFQHKLKSYTENQNKLSKELNEDENEKSV